MTAHPKPRVQVIKQGSQFTFDHSRAMMRELSQDTTTESRHGTRMSANFSRLPDRSNTLDRSSGRFSNCRAAVLMAAFNLTTSSAVSDTYSVPHDDTYHRCHHLMPY